jgi:hypothetical protein
LLSFGYLEKLELLFPLIGKNKAVPYVCKERLIIHGSGKVSTNIV